jgi:hypothetical protein
MNDSEISLSCIIHLHRLVDLDAADLHLSHPEYKSVVIVPAFSVKTVHPVNPLSYFE